jgi:hypothetical protein
MPKLRSVFTLAAVLGTLASCGGKSPPPNEREIEATSSKPVTAERTPVAQDTPTLKQLPRVDTGGDCAPRYLHGGFGTCVNGRPCRGFGVREEKGAILCSCYGDLGGCAEGQRCDERKLTCVADEEPPFNKTR